MKEQHNEKGLIFDIQRFSIHDGPGIRTTVFFKGCNMRCFWCHNPESYKNASEISFFPIKCIGCGKCFMICERGCHLIDSADGRIFDRERCIRCGKCVQKCYAGALVKTGTEYTVDDIIKTVSADIPFYINSCGGMTCSGGEPLLQYSFTGALMAVAKAKGVHTALDTAGNVGYAAFEHVLPYTDLVLYDIKCMDADLHRRVTGVGNELILSNLKRLTSDGKRVWIRIPVISGINDNIQNMFATAEYLSSLSGIEKLELLPYHNLGLGKYESLGMIEKRQDTIKPPNEEVLSVLADAFTGAGYEVAIN